VLAVSTDEDRYQAEKYVEEAKLPFPRSVGRKRGDCGQVWSGLETETDMAEDGVVLRLPSTNLLSEERFLSLRQAALKPTTWLEHGTSLLYGLDYVLVFLLLAVWSFSGRSLRRD
jgi:hypothetical protein